MPPLPRPLTHPLPGRLLAFALLLTAAPAPAAPPPPPAPPPRPAGTADDSIYDPPSPKTVYEEQEEAERTDKARTLFRLGVGLIDAGRWVEAYTTLSEAWKLKQHWQVGYQLARAEVVTGHARGAIEHLDLALADPDPEAQQTRPKFQALLDEARSKLAYLRIDGSPPGARVLVDGEERGTLPLTEPVAVDPGEREIVSPRRGPS